MNLHLILLSLLFLSCKDNKQLSTTERFTIQETLDKLVLTNNVPGINFSYINSHGNQYNFSSGFENTTTQNKLNTSHRMLSGSVGKTYVAAIILQLVDENKIKLEDKILDHLPNYDWLDRLANIDVITVEMLLSHTSGLPRWVLKPSVWSKLSNDSDKVWSYKERLAYIFDEESIHEPSEDWAYSDTNYILLGLLIETVLNQNFSAAIQTRIIQPNSLDETYLSNKRKLDQLAMGYSQLPESFNVPNQVLNENGEYVFNPQFEWTGGGMISTASDLAKWTKVFYTTKLISDELREKMTTVNKNGSKVISDIHSYGMGSFIYNIDNKTAYGHSGFMPGYNTIMAYFPERNASLAIQVNCDYASKQMKLTSYLNKLLEVIPTELK